MMRDIRQKRDGRDSQMKAGRLRKGKKRKRQNISSPEEEQRRKRGAAQRKKGNRQIVAVAYCVVVVFLCMIGYLVKFMVCDSQEIINNPRNKRQELLAEKVVRGEIRSADGKTLARTVTDGDGKESRDYPYGRVFCHVVGRTENSMTGIEQAQSFPLLTSHSNPFIQLANEFRGRKNQGDHVVTTLDSDLQQAAYDGLGNFKGAVVALEPSTGKVLAMVSKPDYDPNTVLADWDNLVEDSEENSALLNRATQGLYPPGSTFKVLTALEYMQENPKYRKYSYQCTGSDIFQGSRIRCYGGERHGDVGLEMSLAHSCNGSFANIGMGLDLGSFRRLCEKFRFNKPLSVNFEYNKSRFTLTEKADSGEITQTAIGQGKTMITPLQNALVSAAIANDGEMMSPYLVDHVENDQEQTIKTYSPVREASVISKKAANQVTRMMKSVISDGTASSLRYLPYAVAGKTGTAEFDSEGTSHAWFVGFAPADKPKIAVSVIVEGAGTGSQYAVPIAKKMFEEYLGS